MAAVLGVDPGRFRAPAPTGRPLDALAATEAARLLNTRHGLPGCDYVLIARSGVTARPWPRLLDDVKSALISLAAETGSAGGVEAPDPSRTG